MLQNRIKMDSIEAIIEEFEIEKLMRGNGVARFHKNVDKAVEKSQESKTEVRHAIAQDQAGKAKRGYRDVFKAIFRQEGQQNTNSP